MVLPEQVEGGHSLKKYFDQNFNFKAKIKSKLGKIINQLAELRAESAYRQTAQTQKSF